MPRSALLETPHLVEKGMADARESFYELAKSRITYRSREDHYAFEREIHGENWQRSGAVVVVQRSISEEGSYINKWVTALEISVNKDLFGEEHADLIPYAVEHEIYEIWLWAKRGYTPQNGETRHLLARRREYEMAMRDGKAEKLLDFDKRVNPTIISELEYAYQKARGKQK